MELDVMENLMRDVAIKNKLIAHTEESQSFLRDSITNLLGAVRNKLQVQNKYCLVMENPEGSLMDAGSDNVRDNQAFAFWIIKHVKKDDAAGETTVRNDAMKIGFQIIAKFKKDRIAIPRTTPLHWLDLNTVRYHPLGPVLDSCYGYRFELAFNEPANSKLLFNPDDWN